MLTSTVPDPGQTITAYLPGEVLRVSVTEILRPDLILARIPVATQSKSHTLKLNDIVPLERKAGRLGDEWHAIDLAQKQAEENAQKFRDEAASQSAADATKGRREAKNAGAR